MKTVLRLAEPKDMPQLFALHAQQNRRDRTRYPLAEIFDEDGRQAPNIPYALVIVRGDEVLGGMIFESKCLDMMLIGCNPRVTLMAERERKGILYTLRKMGFISIRALVTKTVVKQLGPVLKKAGFRRYDDRFASFFRDI
jgi:hypothetical protein